MPATCRPDITLRKVWGNIERYRYENDVDYKTLAKVMHMSVPNIYKRKENPSHLRVSDIIYAAKFFGVDVSEMFK